jgi:hypothetical protein
MLYDVRHEPDNPEHPNVHVAALFDGAIQFALEAIDAWDVGNDADAARRTSWVGAVLVDLADSVRWGTGTPGRHISAIIMHLAKRIGGTAITRSALVNFVSDLQTLYELWLVICGLDVSRRAVA